ncbi:DUF1540 domain-containing protein [Clostridium sp. MSJ-8]|uniref:DUF1540 domain-containing protein n=1 Tax=Clostridium sp. MSJ-8 TaxID=2841510 RepID=UPI001C0EE80E|nr:DUF1540 domain-containing protein [Clostridium sp. MSJ-8]MBU5488827.1 DUF1540 domain-containing protein [Clostridium sp. MSJ-8]
MTQLNCGVDNCAYNKKNLCFLDNIQVGGEEAIRSTGTCCNSFIEQTEGAFINSNSEPSLESEIGCNAENCTYNDNCHCHASSIHICGDCASDNRDTCCDTFKCKCD